MTSFTRRWLCGFAVALVAPAAAATSYAQAQTPAQAPMVKQDAVLTTITAKITALDQTTHEVTLKGPLDNTVTFTVDKRVTRLSEMKVGDDVTADYYVAYAAEFRAPTEQEKANPLVVLQEKAKAPAGTAPAAGALKITRAVVTIEGLDRPTKSMTVAGPKGNLYTFQVQDVPAMSKLRLGDTIVVTFAEALAISLEKRTPKL